MNTVYDQFLNEKLPVYVAARYERKDDAKIFADRLHEAGAICTARWIKEDTGPSVVEDKTADDKKRLFIANRDINDIAYADIVVILADPKGTLQRGGKHVECGIAIGLNKPRIIIGEGENVFHWASGSHIVADNDAAIEFLKEFRRKQREGGI